jgi:hypothetical protein
MTLNISSRASRPHWTQGNMIYIDMLRNTVVWGEGTKSPRAKARWGRQRLTHKTATAQPWPATGRPKRKVDYLRLLLCLRVWMLRMWEGAMESKERQ